MSKTKIFLRFFIISVSMCIIGLIGLYYFIDIQSKNEPIIEIPFHFKKISEIDEQKTSADIVLEEGRVQLPVNYAKNVSSYIQGLKDFSRIRAIGVNGDEFLIAAERRHPVGRVPILLKYKNDTWHDITEQLSSVINTMNLSINVIERGENYWLIGGKSFNQGRMGYTLLKYKDNDIYDSEFEDLTEILPKGESNLSIEALAYIPEKGWLIGASYNEGSYIIKYDGGKQARLVYDSKYYSPEDSEKGFQVRSMSADEELFVIGGTNSSFLIYHDGRIGNYTGSVQRILNNNWDSINVIVLDKRVPHYSKFFLIPWKGPVLEYNIANIKKSENGLDNFRSLGESATAIMGNDLLIVTSMTVASDAEKSEKPGMFIKINNEGKTTELCPVINNNVKGLSFIAAGENQALVGTYYDLYKIENTQLFIKSAKIQSNLISTSEDWFKNLKKIGIGYEGEIGEKNNINDIGVNFYISLNNEKSWQEFNPSGTLQEISKQKNKELIWKAELSSNSGDKTPYITKVTLLYQLAFSREFIILLVIIIIFIAVMLALILYKIFWQKKIKNLP